MTDNEKIYIYYMAKQNCMIEHLQICEVYMTAQKHLLQITFQEDYLINTQ